MSRDINMIIDSDDLLEMLHERSEYWVYNDNELACLDKYFEELVNAGKFDGTKLDIKNTVDNLYTNDIIFIYSEDEEWDNLHVGKPNQSSKVLAVSNYTAMIKI